MQGEGQGKLSATEVGQMRGERGENMREGGRIRDDKGLRLRD